jgi:hypothetical protein
VYKGLSLVDGTGHQDFNMKIFANVNRVEPAVIRMEKQKDAIKDAASPRDKQLNFFDKALRAGQPRTWL